MKQILNKTTNLNQKKKKKNVHIFQLFTKQQVVQKSKSSK